MGRGRSRVDLRTHRRGPRWSSLSLKGWHHRKGHTHGRRMCLEDWSHGGTTQQPFPERLTLREGSTCKQRVPEGLTTWKGPMLEKSAPEGLPVLGRTHAGTGCSWRTAAPEQGSHWRSSWRELSAHNGGWRVTSPAPEEAGAAGTLGCSDHDPHSLKPCTTAGQGGREFRSGKKRVVGKRCYKTQGFFSHYHTQIW